MRRCIFITMAWLRLHLAVFSQSSDIQSINHLPVEEGGTPRCVNTLNSVKFKECVVYSEGMKTENLVIRLWNSQECTRYETVHYEPEVLKLSFAAKENFKTISIKVKSASGKRFEGKVLIHKQSKAPCNVAPVAVDDRFILSLDKPFTGKVGDNDKDEDGDYLTFSLTNGPKNAAQFTLNEDGSFSYTPKKGYQGQDWFKYRVSDGRESAEATAYLKVLEYGIEVGLAATIELGCSRSVLKLNVVAPTEYPITVELTISPFSPQLTLWDAATGGKRILTTKWLAGTQPSTIWIDASGADVINATARLMRDGTVKAEDQKTAKTHSVWPRRWCVPNGNPEGNHGITVGSSVINFGFDLNPEHGDRFSKLMDALQRAAENNADLRRINTTGNYDIAGAFTSGPIPLSYIATNSKPTDQCSDKKTQTVWRIEITVAFETAKWLDTIILPHWNQLNLLNKQLTRAAKQEWERFYTAIQIHEEGHRRHFIELRTKCLLILDTFTKTKFIGEALSLGYGTQFTLDAIKTAEKWARVSLDSSYAELEKKIDAMIRAYNQKQREYENITHRGRTQSNDPFTRRNHGNNISTEYDGDILLLTPPPETRTRNSQKNPPKAPSKQNPPTRKK